MTEWHPTSRHLATEPDVYARIKAVYHRPFGELTAPEGWRFARQDGIPQMRPPKYGERYLSVCGIVGPITASADYKQNCVRLILEPIPESKPLSAEECRRLEEAPPKPKEYLIRLRETGEVRLPKRGEWHFGRFGAGVALVDFRVGSYPILRVVSREAL
jgi:hypothetical protein